MEKKKIESIVLQYIKYGEKAYIVQLYSKEYGRIACITYRSKSKKAGNKMGWLQPLSIIQFEQPNSKRKNLQRIQQVDLTLPLYNITSNPIKSSLAFFIAEILSLLLKEQSSDNRLYLFLRQSIEILNLTQKGLANFHIAFLIQLTKHLGYAPSKNEKNFTAYFDLMNGVFTSNRPLHAYFLPSEETNLLQQLLRINYSNMHLYEFSRKERQLIIQRIIEYYRLHVDDFHELKTLPILIELYN